MIVEADHFLDELMEFYRRAKKDGGAVSVTMKRRASLRRAGARPTPHADPAAQWGGAKGAIPP